MLESGHNDPCCGVTGGALGLRRLEATLEGETAGNVRYLRPADAAVAATGEAVIRQGARMLADYFTQQLPSLQDQSDPLCGEIADLAEKHRALAG